MLCHAYNVFGSVLESDRGSSVSQYVWVFYSAFACVTVYVYIQVETFNLIDPAMCYSVFGCVTVYLGVLHIFGLKFEWDGSSVVIVYLGVLQYIWVCYNIFGLKYSI